MSIQGHISSIFQEFFQAPPMPPRRWKNRHPHKPAARNRAGVSATNSLLGFTYKPYQSAATDTHIAVRQTGHCCPQRPLRDRLIGKTWVMALSNRRLTYSVHITYCIHDRVISPVKLLNQAGRSFDGQSFISSAPDNEQSLSRSVVAALLTVCRTEPNFAWFRSSTSSRCCP